MRISSLWAVFAVAAVGLVPLAARATPISPNIWYEFSWTGPGSSLNACTSCTPATNAPDGHPIVAAGDPAWTITTTGSARLVVQDLFLSLDQFNLLDNLVSLGNTSANVSGSDCGSDITACEANAAFSHGNFALAAGAHSFTGTEIAATSIAGAAVFEVVPTPEPTSLALLVAGLVGLAGFGLRRRSPTI